MDTKTTYTLNWNARIPNNPNTYPFSETELPSEAAALRRMTQLRADMERNPSRYGGKYMVSYSVTKITEMEVIQETKI